MVILTGLAEVTPDVFWLMLNYFGRAFPHKTLFL